MCLLGESISARLDGKVVDKDGEPTELYYHIQECDKCDEARLLEIESELE